MTRLSPETSDVRGDARVERVAQSASDLRPYWQAAMSSDHRTMSFGRTNNAGECDDLETAVVARFALLRHARYVSEAPG